MILDKHTGTLSIAEGVGFGPHADFNRVKSWQLGENLEVIGTSDALEQKIVFRNVIVNDDYFIFRLNFSYNKLKLCEIFISPTPFESNQDWNSWSYEDEMKHLEYCKAWLKKEVGETRDFDWGHIWCGYDNLGGFSSIKIRYS